MMKKEMVLILLPTINTFDGSDSWSDTPLKIRTFSNRILLGCSFWVAVAVWPWTLLNWVVAPNIPKIKKPSTARRLNRIHFIDSFLIFNNRGDRGFRLKSSDKYWLNAVWMKSRQSKFKLEKTWRIVQQSINCFQYLCQNKSLQKIWQNSQNPPHIDVWLEK